MGKLEKNFPKFFNIPQKYKYLLSIINSIENKKNKIYISPKRKKHKKENLN